MFLNYFKIALRNILRHRGHAFINVAGLMIGLTCCLLIFQYVAYEYSFDSFNTNGPQLFRVTETLGRPGRTPSTESLFGYALGPAIAEGVPEIAAFTRLHPDYNEPVVMNPEHPERSFTERRSIYADSTFLRIFTFPLEKGDLGLALAEPGTIVLTSSAAKRYFGDEDPIGKTLSYTGWISGSFRVNAVVRDVPSISHLQFDILLPMSDLLLRSGYKNPTLAWTWSNFFVYVRLRSDANTAEVAQKCTNVLWGFRGEEYERTNTQATLGLQALSDIHLNNDIFAPRVVYGSSRTLSFFILVGIITLFIALVNYVNLATARSLDRAREVGIRKVVGAQRVQLIVQFLIESAMLNAAAMVLALVMADACRPALNSMTGANLIGPPWLTPGFWPMIFAIQFAGTILAGLYPAFVLSSFRPGPMLKGSAGTFSLRLFLRRALVTLQFAASVVLIAGTAVVLAQVRFMQTMDVGLKLQHVITVRGPSVLPPGSSNISTMRTLMTEASRLPGVGSMATMTATPGDGFNWYTSGFRRETTDPSTGVSGALGRVDTSFERFFGCEIISGRGFAGMTPPMVETEPINVIANETAVRAAGFRSPAEAIDQIVLMGVPRCRIIGVVKDFHWASAHEPVIPTVFSLIPAGNKLAIRTSGPDLSGTIAALRTMYLRLFPGNPFEYTFLDEQFANQYENDEQFATLFGVFAGFAITIACLGLFALAALITRQRTKEIGLRKVLGSSAFAILKLLSMEHLWLVLLASAIAWPIVFFGSQRWLETFAYRTAIAWWLFPAACIFALMIALITVGGLAARAARANPVEALRYE